MAGVVRERACSFARASMEPTSSGDLPAAFICCWRQLCVHIAIHSMSLSNALRFLKICANMAYTYYENVDEHSRKEASRYEGQSS